MDNKGEEEMRKEIKPFENKIWLASPYIHERTYCSTECAGRKTRR